MDSLRTNRNWLGNLARVQVWEKIPGANPCCGGYPGENPNKSKVIQNALRWQVICVPGCMPGCMGIGLTNPTFGGGP